MKKLIFIWALALVAAGSSAWADQQQASGIAIPSTAKILKIIWGQSYVDMQRAILDAKSQLVRDEASLGVENTCAQLYRQWNFLQSQGGHNSYKYNVTVTLHCVQRDLQQMQIGSLHQACQKSPQAECFQPQFLDYLKSFRPTEYFDIWPSKSKR